jgi:hypothetical protein
MALTRPRIMHQPPDPMGLDGILRVLLVFGGEVYSKSGSRSCGSVAAELRRMNSILRSSAATLPQLLDPDLLYTSPPKTNNTRNIGHSPSQKGNPEAQVVLI